ncbi:hypothetical protein [Pseudomonas fontis]|uniref:Uncharacterized protein n=1 Tax=Pseudomonas fontis TaxID=2942633 RepID=A0ABT5NTJ1_9PSED|nr:hypothetical protein [Pseudomonas fontis]MDD0976861.1 hypothetical protein [Pseudomonas fontis]MDD0991490.1 hypothetical protein [Pseudomonas fontis]
MVRAVFFNDAFRAAFKHAEALCSDDKHKIKEIVLVIPAMANLKGSTSLVSFLGPEATKALNKGEAAVLRGMPITLKTERTLSGLTPNTLVVCAYASQSMMDKVDGFGRVAGVIALPFAKDVINSWMTSWSPLVDGKQPHLSRSVATDGVVLQAMEGLTATVGVATGVLHNSDKERIDRVLRILRKKGHTLDATALRAWAVGSGWAPKAADELEKLATRIAGLKNKPTLSSPDQAEQLYASWVTKASQ